MVVTLFSDAIEDIRRTVNRAHTDPTEYDYCGVPVIYEDSSLASTSWDDWEPVLEEWMPRFDRAGWLDGLTRIKIGDSYTERECAAGQYKHDDQVVVLKQDLQIDNPELVSDTKEYALIHEMTHHAHMKDLFIDLASVDNTDLVAQQQSFKFHRKSDLFAHAVSKYAGTNYLEAVAETASGIILGEEYPERVRREYVALKGPEPVCNWVPPSEKSNFRWKDSEFVIYKYDPAQ